MKLYKYRSFHELGYIMDVIVNERLYCARYDTMNDPFEGLFVQVLAAGVAGGVLPTLLGEYDTGSATTFLGHGPHHVTTSIQDIFSEVDLSCCRICSLSSSLSDVRLWSHYADGNRGVALEIDLAGLDESVREIMYCDQLLQGGTLLAPVDPLDVLARKTKHWEYEAEHRLFHQGEYFDIKGRLKAIYAGSRISEDHLAFLDKMRPTSVPIIRTRIDAKSVEVCAG